MSCIDKNAAWENVLAHGQRLQAFHLRDVNQNAARSEKLSLKLGPLQANFARQRLDSDALNALFELAESSSLTNAVTDMFNGKHVNASEQRAALHTALRSDLVSSADSKAAYKLAVDSRKQMADLIQQLEASDVTDIINIGIGGSDLGPRLAVDALRDFHSGRFRVHFISNVDGSNAQHVLNTLDPAKTAVILVS